MTDPDQHAKDRGALESLLQMLPGFGGYIDKQHRRDADHLARTQLAGKIDAAKPQLDRFMKAVVSKQQLDELSAVESVRDRIDRLVQKIGGDVRGYSSFFDFVKVDEELLEDVYVHDMSLFRQAEIIASGAADLAKNPDEVVELLAALNGDLDRLERDYAKRADLLNGLGDDSLI